MTWYNLTIEQLYRTLGTSSEGLAKSEIAPRIKKYGENRLIVRKDSIWKLLFEPFRNVFVAVLLAAATISIVNHESLDAIIIGAIIVINSCIYYSQQYATARVLRSLQKHNNQQVSVTRDGDTFSVSSDNLVPGDIVLLNEGDRIPADARVIHSDNLQTNESSLTGESVPVHKNASTLETKKQVYEQDNMVFQGTYVMSGTAKVLVVETANRTELGKIAALASEDKTKSPVQSKIDHLIALLVKMVGALSTLVFILALSRGIPYREAIRFVLSLTVSAVPEGLPVALTVIIVLGMRRMAKQKALVRNFKAIEDVGLITTIATDKTGTLTKNHLTIVDDWSLGSTDVTTIIGKTLDLSSEQSDPIDEAIREKVKLKDDHGVEKVYAFDITLRMSGALNKDGWVYIKGSPEHMLAKSNVTSKQKKAIESAIHELASKGYRVVACGKYKLSGSVPNDLSNIKNGDIDFVGCIAFADELRPEANAAIRSAHEAGISVRLITGDHFETAYNIGKQIHLAEHIDDVIKGTDLPKGDNALALAIKNKTVFARILPEDKFRILRALKRTEITAMTGDGVNDVPALTNAHVGIAMGSGSDIAKDAGGIILLNDNFATIIKAISEGRKIFDNIRRMLFYLISTSLGEVLTMIGALLFNLPLPVTAIQILWINLVTDTAMVLPLGLEPEEEGHMKRPPRHPKDPLLSRVLLFRVGLISVTMALVTLIVVHVLKGRGHTTSYIQTVAFITLIAAQWMNAFNARSEYFSSFGRIRKINYGLLIGFTVAIGLQALVMFGPLRPLFNIQAVPISTLLTAIGVVMVAILAISEIHKLMIRLLGKQRMQ